MATFQISDYYQLLTLHKTILEAKFHQDPNRPELAGSPILAEVANRIVDTLVKMEQEPNSRSTSGAPHWTEWRQTNRSRPEWKIAVLRAMQSVLWTQWSFAEKEDFALALLSPFTVDEIQIQEFIDEVDNLAQEKGD